MKNVVTFGGGTGMSFLLKGLKEKNINLSAVVSVCDDGRSTGRLREEFNIPAVGDIRKIIISLSETEPLVEKLLNYRFSTYSDLNNHTVGNLLLTALLNITGNMSDGIEALSKILNLKGNVIPLTEDNVVLMADFKDGNTIEGEHNITSYNGKIKKVYYKIDPEINKDVIAAIKEADEIIFSMGSIYTSILPNLIVKEVIEALDCSKANFTYICNLMTQPGETDNFKVLDHVKLLNSYLGKKKIDRVIVNNSYIPDNICKKYETLEEKSPVLIDDNIEESNIELIEDDFVSIENGIIRHNTSKLADCFYNLINN